MTSGYLFLESPTSSGFEAASTPTVHSVVKDSDEDDGSDIKVDPTAAKTDRWAYYLLLMSYFY